MASLRAKLAPVLSVRLAGLAQRATGHPWLEGAGRRLSPARFAWPAPRPGDRATPVLAATCRPIHFPQRGSGTMYLIAPPPPGTPQFATLVRTARRREIVVVGPDAVSRPIGPGSVVALAACGAPLAWRDGPHPPPEALHGLTGTAVVPTGDPRRDRELRSIRARRWGHDRLRGRTDGHTGAAVSVLLATMRPDDLDLALGQIAAQRDARIQPVVGLHGAAWPQGSEDRVRELAPDATVVRFGDERSLGEVLSSLTERAEFDLVSKWDDDDWYGPDHIADLVRAYEYSGADLVGKAAEFVRLEGADLTIRRFTVGAESYAWTLAGGTLMASKRWIDEVGGWPPVRRGVDRALLDAARHAGARAYRTHGFQYVLRRRPDGGHTWRAGDEAFLAQAKVRRAGLDLAYADVEQTS